MRSAAPGRRLRERVAARRTERTREPPNNCVQQTQSLGSIPREIVRERSSSLWLSPPENGAQLVALARLLRDVPIWIFHGERDRVVPMIGSREPAAALRDAGSTARHTRYFGLDRNSWDATYAPKWSTDWLFAKRR